MFKYEKILRMLEDGKKVDDIAKTFKVSRQYIYSIRNKYGKGKISTNVEKKATKKSTEKVKLPVSKPKEKKGIESYWGRLPASEETQALDGLVNRFLDTHDKERDDRDAQQIDWVNSPSHYKIGGIETIDFIEAKQLNYNLGNVVKYITRADHKGNREQDLNKALWYLIREIDSFSEV